MWEQIEKTRWVVAGWDTCATMGYLCHHRLLCHHGLYFLLLCPHGLLVPPLPLVR